MVRRYLTNDINDSVKATMAVSGFLRNGVGSGGRIIPLTKLPVVLFFIYVSAWAVFV